MIIAHLVHDTHSLLTCSLISRSWYSAAVHDLHRTLFTQTGSRFKNKTQWPKPLRMASKFGFLPLITRVIISGGRLPHDQFSQTKFDHWTRYEFSKLTNVLELSINYLNIPSFIPSIQEYFGQFSPTLRSLTLISAEGSGRQVAFFVGLFPHLEDVNLRTCWGRPWEMQLSDTTLVLPSVPPFVPPSIPPLGGRLTIHSGDRIAKGMVDLFGELRFRHMDLRWGGVQHLLYACPNTLETLKLDAIDICGEDHPFKGLRTPANDFIGGSHRDLDLSRNKSLRKLQITAESLISCFRKCTSATIRATFKAMLSTIKSPAFSDVMVIYRRGDFHSYASKAVRLGLGDEETWYHRKFEVFRAMYEARDYRLVLSMECVGDNSVRELKRAVARERAKGGLPLQIATPYTLMAD